MNIHFAIPKISAPSTVDFRMSRNSCFCAAIRRERYSPKRANMTCHTPISISSRTKFVTLMRIARILPRSVSVVWSRTPAEIPKASSITPMSNI